MRTALSLANDNAYVIAVIGDASLANGMALEAINHTSELRPTRFIVLLNDNGMSIAPSVGGLSRILSKNDPDARTFFGLLGFSYIGPVDGHSLAALIAALRRAKTIADSPVLLHVKTTKGKGFAPAENAPLHWHGIAPTQDRGSPPSQSKAASPKTPPTYSEVFGAALIELAERDERVTAITAGMPDGTGLRPFAERFPRRFFDVGIAEEHAVTLAAGMACEGLRPFVAVYSSFLQRAYDQVVHDVLLQRLPVVFAVDRAGVVGEDGETHQGIFDIAFLRAAPGITIMSPKDEGELRHMLYTTLERGEPAALRYPRGIGRGADLKEPFRVLPHGEAEVLAFGDDGAIIAFGPLVQRALRVRRRCRLSLGLEITVVNARYAKPLDADLFGDLLTRVPLTCTLEDHALAGGFGSALLEFADRQGISLDYRFRRFGVSDSFVAHATQSEQQRSEGYDEDSIAAFFARNSLRVPLTRLPQTLFFDSFLKENA